MNNVIFISTEREGDCWSGELWILLVLHYKCYYGLNERLFIFILNILVLKVDLNVVTVFTVIYLIFFSWYSYMSYGG